MSRMRRVRQRVIAKRLRLFRVVQMFIPIAAWAAFPCVIHVAGKKQAAAAALAFILRVEHAIRLDAQIMIVVNAVHQCNASKYFSCPVILLMFVKNWNDWFWTVFLSLCTVGMSHCANIPASEGGTISGEIFLNTATTTFNGKDIVLHVAADSSFNNVVLTSVYPIDKPRLLIELFGVSNGKYYLMAFEDKNDNGILDLNLPTGDGTLSENFGIYDNDGYYSDFEDPSSYLTVEVQNNAVENIYFYIDSAN